MLNKYFTFRFALIASVILHIILLCVFVLREDDKKPEDKKEEIKYIKVKIGRMHYESVRNAHSKPKPPKKKVQKAQTPAPKKVEVKQPKPVKKTVVKKKPIVKPIKRVVAKPVVRKAVVSVKKVIVPQKKQVRKKRVSPRQGNAEKQQRAAQAARGVEIGNKRKAEQEAVNDYRQTITLWLQKHKVYPKAAENLGLGDKVDAKVKLRIARNGRLVRYWLLESAGNNIIDDAVILMIKNSNPFPPFPADYPQANVDDFEIGMEVRLKRSIADRLYNP